MDENLRMVIELQKIDLAVKDLDELQKRIPLTIAEVDRDLAASKTVLSEYRKKLETLEKTRKAWEHDIEANNDKRKKYETQLYTVKSNKEYSSLLNEIEELNKSSLQIEEMILSNMEETDDMRRKLALKEAEFKEEVNQSEKRKREQQKELETVLAHLEEHRNRRQELVSKIDQSLVTKYNKIAHVRHNAVVPIVSKACSGCYMKVRPQVYMRAKQSQSIVICDNCSRILYVDDHKENGENEEHV